MIKKFLQYLQQQVPAGPRRHHITVEPDSQRLEVGVWLNGSCHRFLLEEHEQLDLKTAKEIVSRLI